MASVGCNLLDGKDPVTKVSMSNLFKARESELWRKEKKTRRRRGRRKEESTARKHQAVGDKRERRVPYLEGQMKG